MQTTQSDSLQDKMESNSKPDEWCLKDLEEEIDAQKTREVIQECLEHLSELGSDDAGDENDAMPAVLALNVT
uniref:NET domain-containing protein n=1 Tax=Mesocestoides corti TaxID=53468 RepID=A0A5K3EH19_MESCO